MRISYSILNATSNILNFFELINITNKPDCNFLVFCNWEGTIISSSNHKFRNYSDDIPLYFKKIITNPNCLGFYIFTYNNDTIIDEIVVLDIPCILNKNNHLDNIHTNEYFKIGSIITITDKNIKKINIIQDLINRQYMYINKSDKYNVYYIDDSMYSIYDSILYASSNYNYNLNLTYFPTLLDEKTVLNFRNANIDLNYMELASVTSTVDLFGLLCEKLSIKNK